MDDYAIASAAAQAVIAEEIKDYAPPFLRSSITPDKTQKFADAIAHAVVDALNAAHAPKTGL